jgi:hypothetical protein
MGTGQFTNPGRWTVYIQKQQLSLFLVMKMVMMICINNYGKTGRKCLDDEK